MCSNCQSRVGATGGFPFSRDRFTVDGLFRLSFARWKENWALFLLLFGGLIAAVYAVSLGGELILNVIAEDNQPLQSPFHPVRIGFHIVNTILQLMMQLLLLGACLDVLQGRKTDVQAAVVRLHQLPNALLQLLVIYAALAIELGLLYLLFVALGGFGAGWKPFAITAGTAVVTSPAIVYVWLGVTFAMLVLVHDPRANAFSALATSWRIAAHHRFEILGICLLAGIVAMLGVIACCVGVFVSLPIASLLYCSLFLALSNDTRPAEVQPAETRV